jgi:hypothetical protein
MMRRTTSESTSARFAGRHTVMLLPLPLPLPLLHVVVTEQAPYQHFPA